MWKTPRSLLKPVSIIAMGVTLGFVGGCYRDHPLGDVAEAGQGGRGGSDGGTAAADVVRPTDASPIDAGSETVPARPITKPTGWKDCGTVSPTAAQTQEIFALSPSPGGRYVAVVHGHSADLWDREGPSLKYYFSYGFDVDVALNATFSSDSKFIAATGDGAVIYRMGDRRKVDQYSPAIDGTVTNGWWPRIAFSGKDSPFVISHDRVIEIRSRNDILEGLNLTTPTATLKAARTPIALALSPDGTLVTSGEEMWRIADGKLLWSVPRFMSPGGSVPDRWAVFSHDGQHLVISECALTQVDYCRTPNSKVLNVADGSEVRSFSAARHPVFSPDDSFILAGDSLIEVNTGKTWQLDLPVGVAGRVSAFVSAAMIAIAGSDNVIRLLCQGSA